AQTLDFSSLEYIFYGAAPTAPEKIREAIDVFGPVMFQIFGQTETMFPNTCLTREDHFVEGEIAPADRLTSCGRQAPFCKLAIMDEDGTLLPPGEVGELVYRGAGLMQGYYKNPEATAEAATFGWHHTGDIARMDEDGFVFIVDRKKDMIISGGFNVFSVEVEAAVLTMPAIRDCAVIGAPDEKWGEAIVACVELKAGESMEAEEIIAHCKERLGGVKAPKSLEFWDEIPKTPNGKTDKKAIRAQFWDDTGRAVH
ncbi:MAG: AMP-binding protein, partial [Alphaproteobacteria bacterium]|nr:AMP-binding protein [Alphaproteobacteria bacterium]